MAAQQPFAVSGKRMSVIPCQSCEKVDKSTPASSFCINCAEFQCQECLIAHKRYADLKNHQIISTNEAEDYFPPEISRCQECHKEQYESICKKHDARCCRNCAYEYHADCSEDLVHLGQIEFNVGFELKKLRQEVTNNIEKVKSTADKMLTLKEACTHETNKKIQEMQDKMNETFENFKRTVSQRIASAFTSDKNYTLELEGALIDIENISKETNPHQRIHDVDVLKAKIQILMEELDNNFSDKQTVDVRLTFHDSMKLPPNVNAEPGEFTITNVKANNISDKLTATELGNLVRNLNVEVIDTTENEVQGRSLDFEITDISDGTAVSELDNTESNVNFENMKIANVTKENENGNQECNVNDENTERENGTNENKNENQESNMNDENTEIENGTNEKENGNQQSNMNVEKTDMENGTKENENGDLESNITGESTDIVNGTNENENGNPESNKNVESKNIVNGTNENENGNPESNMNVESTNIVNGTNENENGNPESNMNVEKTMTENENENGNPESNMNVEKTMTENENENGNPESNMNVERKNMVNGTNENENGNPESNMNVESTNIVNGTNENGKGNPERNMNVEKTMTENENENRNPESNLKVENMEIVNDSNENEKCDPESNLNVENTEIVNGTNENENENTESNMDDVFANYPAAQIDNGRDQIEPVCNLQLLSSMDLNAVGNEEEPFYTGIDFMPDGRLLAVDNVNKKCTLFNQNLDEVNSYQLSHDPQSVVAASENEVAITKGYAHKIEILFISETNEISAMGNINVTKPYGSICMMDGDNFLVGSFDDLQPVRVVSVLGEEKEIGIKFPAKKYTLGNFACAFILNCNKVALTDKFAHTVYIYDIANKTSVEVFDRKFIRQPSGLAVGPNDCIFVCCTNSIVQISHTGQILSSHVLDIWFPQCICVSKDNTKIAVSNGAVGAKKLQLYSIQMGEHAPSQK